MLIVIVNVSLLCVCNSVSFFVIHIVSSLSYQNVSKVCNRIVSSVNYRIVSSLSYQNVRKVCNRIVSSENYRIVSSVSKSYC